MSMFVIGPKEEFVLHLELWAAVLGIAAVVGPILWWAFKKIRAAIRNRIDVHMETLKTARKIMNELQPNGGGSLRDAIDDIKIHVQIVEQMHTNGLNAMELPYWISDETGFFMQASPTLYRMLRVSPEDMLGNNWVTLVHPDDRSDVKAAWDHSVNESRTFHATFRMMRSDGETICVRAHAAPLVNRKTNKVVKYFGSVTQINEHVN